ncbi:hypothetical protein M407DRAFT_4692 [Tulasnella calospora MUT 4182]|uniref:DUF6535 domain-containing protein n=1 Tax=Tulasnella calospora MUT 4182 TaxID=1051891 RepID=A0A0C3QIY8_9AGAM|nr:hypothetical protein M407DRAFT_4692 [Tulasnella calospora MUT 4182]
MSSMIPRQSTSAGISSSRRRLGRSVRRRSGRKPKDDDDEIEVPSKFGNAADYWKHFDQVSSARNRQLMDSLNQNLDLLLVFTGLTDEDLEAPKFTASDEAIRLARFFSVSLTLTLLAAFGAMVGKQWMIYYSHILRAVAQSIPTLFERKAMTLLLKDKAVIRLHRLFRASIAQAEDAPDALVQDSDDKSNPAVNAVIYGRAIVHLFIALGPHDDWFWDDYETALHHGWLEPWTLDGVDDVPDKVIVELEQQRLIIQACLSIGPDGNAASTQVEESALPLYIAANIKALLHRRVYHHLCHYPPKFRPTVESWTGETDLERVAFCTVFPEDYPKTIGLVAWALATVPYRVYDHNMRILEKYNMFWSDLKELWDAYSSTSHILRNVAKALKEYPLSTERPPDDNHLPTSELKTTYKAMLEAARLYIKNRATKEDVLTYGPELVHAIGGLRSEMERVRYLSDEDEEIRAILQPIVDAVVVRRGQRLRQHVRSLSGSVIETRPSPTLEKGWFEGNTPAALEEYSEWITTHRSSSPDLEPRNLFLNAWNQGRAPRERRVDLEPSEDDDDEEKPRR